MVKKVKKVEKMMKIEKLTKTGKTINYKKNAFKVNQVNKLKMSNCRGFFVNRHLMMTTSFNKFLPYLKI